MPWVETGSPSFVARHEAEDVAGARQVLGQLETTRSRLAGAFRTPDSIAVVLHASPAALALAQPYLPLLRALTAPAGRRYLAGWFSATELHMLAPRALARRASNVDGSKEMLDLTAAALYTQLAVAVSNERLPPPFRPASFARYVRWAWLPLGAGQYFSGQTAFARHVVARRLREGPRPVFPPRVRDAPVLGGTVFDLVATERGQDAAVALAQRLPKSGAVEALRHVMPGRSGADLERQWREHLASFAEPESELPKRRSARRARR
jgi:hypothetical protein